MFSIHNKIEDYIVKRLSNYDLALAPCKQGIEIRMPVDALYNVLSFLQHDTHCHFDQLLDLVVLDYPDRDKRFELIYVVRSLKNNQQIQVSTTTHLEVASISEIYKNAGWLEREAWEMFGIFFKNSRDLRRLLTDFRVGGHPLRHDYPSSGFTDYVFQGETDQFVSVPLSLEQEARLAHRQPVWKGPQHLKAEEPCEKNGPVPIGMDIE